LNLNSSLELTSAFGGAYRGKRVLVTGHTGFKGSWLCEWLLALGAEVTGFALDPATSPALFVQLGLSGRIKDVRGDVRDLGAVCKVVAETRPDFVFHLAAQALVRLSYDQPVETYATNIMGTVNVLEALRCYQNELKSQVEVEGQAFPSATELKLPASTHRRVIPAVMITTDKCYENKEWVHSYREEDPMGGYDPYSSSKGAAELVISAYRRSYFSPLTSNLNLNLNSRNVRVASARAGNVIGGGDWALDRIVPDCIRALKRGEAIPVRNKVATRPWQHVLEPLSGYLWLGACLAKAAVEVERLRSGESPSSDLNLNYNLKQLNALSGAFNFGPALSSNRTVADLVREILKHWPGRWDDKSDPHAVHEAKLLNLATDKAHHFLGWKPAWDFEQTINKTVTWYREAGALGSNLHQLTTEQIIAYTAAAKTSGLAWAD